MILLSIVSQAMCSWCFSCLGSSSCASRFACWASSCCSAIARCDPSGRENAQAGVDRAERDRLFCDNLHASSILVWNHTLTTLTPLSRYYPYCKPEILSGNNLECLEQGTCFGRGTGMQTDCYRFFHPALWWVVRLRDKILCGTRETSNRLCISYKMHPSNRLCIETKFKKD